ncbi:hypothetical protein WR25_17067 isoform D [Diploscapter pachys]|uniref:Fork-head domain-containing protein n=1 Tax=Diploscapter pachys TaxID=2018661 RepID=A0A2A2L3R1_9BILA|nr:hypothetical protein WR25_17067 isoform B [Diploscapter pachys]PAV80824.1 hypothetical protein WR25_17067 isoform D [Diploscapter pachys]
MEDGGCLSVLLSTVASPSEEDFDLQFSLWPTCSTSASASASSSSAPTPSPSSSLDDSDSLCSIDSSDRAFDVCFPNFDFTCGTSDSDLYSSIFNDQNEQLDARNYYQTQNERATEDAESSNSTQECSMICWLFRTLLTSEYRALPLNAIFDLFERTVGREQDLGRERRLQPSRCSPRARHWRLCIRHVLLTSPVFVRVLTPNPRKDFLVISEAGNWWTVQPSVEELCAMDVLTPGPSHKCPPPVKNNSSYKVMCSLNNDWVPEKRRESTWGRRFGNKKPAGYLRFH